MRILHVLASAGWGGLESAVVSLANALTPHVSVSVLVDEDARSVSRFSEDVEVRALPRGSRRNPVTIHRLAKAIEGIGPDLVHTHAAKATEMVGWAQPLSPVPMVATKHNTRRRSVFRRVRWVAAVSDDVARTIEHPHGVVVVNNGIDVRAVAPGPKPEVFTIAAVGRLDRYKGFDVLIEQLRTLEFPFRLRIAGEGRERRRLERQIERWGLEDRVELLGYRDDVPELLSRCHLQIVPSRSEGFGMALVEGVHYADLVFATPVGIAAEVLPDTFLVAPDEIGAAVSRAHGRYDALVRDFRDVKNDVVGRFSWSRAAEEYLALYRRTLVSGGPPTR